MKRLLASRGFTIIEVLITLLVLGIVIVAVVRLISNTVTVESSSDRRAIASNLARQTVEDLKKGGFYNITVGTTSTTSGLYTITTTVTATTATFKVIHVTVALTSAPTTYLADYTTEVFQRGV
jgi:prepilin-type N-terminal cleavage/methylation domain-containing protein